MGRQEAEGRQAAGGLPHVSAAGGAVHHVLLLHHQRVDVQGNQRLQGATRQRMTGTSHRPAAGAAAQGIWPQIADQPPSQGRIAPLMLAASSESRKAMAEATCSGVATEGRVASVAPSRASRSAVDRPIPEPAPVTIAVFPANRPGTVSVPWLMTATSPVSGACRGGEITLRRAGRAGPGARAR